MDILVLFLILEEMLSVFHHWEWCLLWVCCIWLLLCWGTSPLCPFFGQVFNQNRFLNHLRWSYGFYSSIYSCGYITLIEFADIETSLHPWSKSTYSWCMIHFIYYCRGSQPLSCRPLPVHSLLGTGPHSRWWEVGECAKLHLLLPITGITAWTTPQPRPWKNCLPWNWSLVPKRLGTTVLLDLVC